MISMCILRSLWAMVCRYVTHFRGQVRAHRLGIAERPFRRPWFEASRGRRRKRWDNVDRRHHPPDLKLKIQEI